MSNCCCRFTDLSKAVSSIVGAGSTKKVTVHLPNIFGELMFSACARVTIVTLSDLLVCLLPVLLAEDIFATKYTYLPTFL